jgi:hypothetical protein
MTTTFAFLFHAGDEEINDLLVEQIAILAEEFGYRTSETLNSIEERPQDFHVLEGLEAIVESKKPCRLLLISNSLTDVAIQPIVWANPSAAPVDVRHRFLSFLADANALIRSEIGEFEDNVFTYKLLFAEYWRHDTPVRHRELHFDAALDLLSSPDSWHAGVYRVDGNYVHLTGELPLMLTVRLQDGWPSQEQAG